MTEAIGIKSLIEDGQLTENLSIFRGFMLFQIYTGVRAGF